MRVMVVDDEKPCLNDLIYMLSCHADVEIAGAFTLPEDALASAPDIRPDALFIDLCMPRLGGAELGKRMLALLPGARIVFVTGYARELESVSGLPSFGSLLKPVRAEKLAEVLERLRSAACAGAGLR